MPLTITEALAEIKTIGKRLAKKREAIGPYLARQEGIKDPLEKSGGSPAFLISERQAIADLESRIVELRRGIRKANEATTIVIEGKSQTIADWLIWRREIAPGVASFLGGLRASLNNIRLNAQKNGNAVVSKDGQPAAPTDVLVNLDEADLNKSIETLETILGTLDGQLSLKNATVLIEE